MKNRQGQEIEDLMVGEEVACEWQSGLTDQPRREQHSLVGFLGNLPFFSQGRILPPHKILNRFLAEGVTGEGMRGTCSWSPFQLSEQMYQQLVGADEPRFSSPKPAEWVDSFSDWYIWLMEERHGIPAKEHKRLKDNLIHLERLANLPKGSVDRRKQVDYHIRSVEARTQLHEFLAKEIERIRQQTSK